MPFIADSETTGRFIPDEGRFIPDEAPTASPPQATAQLAPLTSGAFHPGRENPELGLYDLRVPNVNVLTGEKVYGPPTEGLLSTLSRGIPLQPFSIGQQLENIAKPQKAGPGVTSRGIPALEIPAGIVKGAENVATGAMQFVTSPLGIATLGLGAAPGAIKTLASTAFAADMASHAPDAYQKFEEARLRGDAPGQAEAITEGLGTLAMAGLAGSHPYLEARKAIIAGRESRLNKPVEFEAQMGGHPIVRPIDQLAPRTAAAISEPTAEPKFGDVLPEAPLLTKEQQQRVAEKLGLAKTPEPPAEKTLGEKIYEGLVRQEEAPKAPTTPQGVSEPVPTPQNAPTGQPSPIAAKPKKLSVDDMISQVGENGLDAALSYFGQDAGIDVALRGGRIIVPAADRARATGIFSGKKGGATQPFLEWLASDKALAEHIDEATAADIKKLRTALGVEAPTAPPVSAAGAPEQPVKAAEGIPEAQAEVVGPAPQPQSPSAPFSPKQAKAQKAYLLEEIDKAHKEAPEGVVEYAATPPNEGVYGRNVEKFGTITIRVPGDGVFTIINERGAIERFKEMAKQFPTTSPRPSTPKTASTKPTVAAPVASSVGKPEVLKATELFTSQDETRLPLYQVMWSDGTRTVSTDGRRMIIVEQGLGGTKKAPKVFDLSGKEKVQPEGQRFPQNWEQVIPQDAPKFRIEVDTEQLHNIVRQAELMTTERAPSVRIAVNPDNTIGVSSLNAELEGFAHNVHANPQQVVFLQPEYLRDALNAARRLGDEKVQLAIIDELSPVQLIGSKHRSIIMPMRGAGGTPIETVTPKATEAPNPAAPVAPPPEPAISFPGLGSLREADATPMRLGQIRKAEPELWKAMTQHFGVDAPAKIAKLAKERFEQMRNAPPDKPPTKWASATEEPPLGTALYGPFGIPSPAATAKAVIDLAKAAAPKVKDAYEAAKEIGQEALNAEKMTDYRRSVLNWSAKLQRSFGESAAAQKEIRSKVPDEVRREGITNWIQAGGDTNLLAQRAAATTDPKLKAGYEAAMNLTPEELAVASDVKAAYDALGVRGQTYSVLSNFRDNYVTQIWDLKKGPATGSSRTLKDKFRYSKARAFDTFFDGEQAGYTPKTKDIAKLLPVYMHEMNSVIAARQLVEQMSKGVASDGRPLVAPRGVGVQVGGPMGQATLIIPKVPKGNRLDYKMLENQPALSEWVWRTEDSAGNPVFEKADLALHPEAHARLKKVLGRSAIREWYETRTSAGAQIPKVIVKGLDIAQSETKRTMLGFFAPFHQVQEGTHAIGHRINPFFNIPKVDLVGNARQMDAARHGLMLLPDRVSESQFMEGFQTSGLVSRIPGIGPMADWYSNYLFKQYIPGLKFKTYEAILERNTKVYEKDLASGAIKPEDVKALSAEQANAAYGHLNYADLARDPTIQHIAQIGLLAPDFLEARGRFAWQAAKGAVGTKVGREQVIALATLALAQAATAWIAAKTTGGEWDSRHPFEFTKGSRRYTMRSVPEDIDALVSHSRTFWNSRLSPIIGKGALQYASGVDYAQRKVSPAQTTKELLTAPIPLNIRSIPALQKLTGMDRPGQVNPLEQLAGTMGLKISRNYPRQKLDDLHAKFLKDHPDPKVRADYERHQTETVPVSKYKAVYSALSDRNGEALQKAVDALEAEGEKLKNIKRRLNPRTTEGRRKSLFHERRELEREFRDGLDAEQYKMYEAAMDEREAQWDFFRQYY